MISNLDKIDLTQDGSPSVIETYQQLKAKGAYDDIIEKYHDPATVYSVMVLEGDQIAGEMIQLNAFRHLQDLVRAERDPKFNFYYDLDQCRRILNFARFCPDVNTGSPLPLMMWQQALLCQMQGWRSNLGEKRYRRVVFSVGRTNGKTYLNNIMLAYAFLIESDNMYNQDLAYIAPVTAQSKKGWNYLMTTFSKLAENKAFKQLMQKNDVQVLQDVIRSNKKQNKVLRMSDESGKFDAYHFHFVVSDEVGDDKSIAKIKENNGKITSGQVQEKSAQFVQISTAYPDSRSELYLTEQMMRRAMKEDYKRTLDDNLCIVYEQDSLKEVNPEQIGKSYDIWEKSNPILGLEDSHDSTLDHLKSERDTKMEDGTFAEFQNKNLNIWLKTAANTYLQLNDINKSIVQEPPIDITGQPVFIGFDASQKSDDTSLTFTFPYVDPEDGLTKFYITGHSWIPTEHSQGSLSIKSKTDNINYSFSIQNGWAEVPDNDYGMVDLFDVEKYVLDFVDKYQLDVKCFAFDSWHVEDFIDDLNAKVDWTFLPIRQGSITLNNPTKKFRQMIISDRIRFENDPVLVASLKNAILLTDNNGIKIDKDARSNKIDYLDSIIDAFDEATRYAAGIEKKEDDTGHGAFKNMTQEEIHDYYQNTQFVFD